MDQTMIDYIRKSRDLGRSDQDIKSLLLNAGHNAVDIDAAFDALKIISDSQGTSLVPPPPPPASGYRPKDGGIGDQQPRTDMSLLSPTALLGQAWHIYRQRWATLFGITIIAAFISLAFFLLYSSKTFIATLQGSPIILIILSLVLYLVVIVSEVWAATALISAIKYNQEGIGVVESYRRGWRYTSSYFWVSILMGLILLGGLALLIVPGIIFAVWFCLAGIIVIVEDLKGMNALLKSKEYVRGRLGSVFVRFLFIFVLSLLVSLVPYLVNTFINTSIGSICSFIILLFGTPLWLAYIFSLYANLKSSKGEFVFAPTSKQKTPFVIVAIIGPVCFIAVFFFLINVVLNPSDLLAQARDGQRMSDLDTVSTAINTYLSQAKGTPNLDVLKSPNGICSHEPNPGGAPFTDGNCKVVTSTMVDGSGWVDVDLADLPGGSPLAVLPVDPVDNGTYFYAYKADPATYTFELYARLESTEFRTKMVNIDTGGPCVTYTEPTCWYEVGTNPAP